jgi:hypothetical protein
MPLDLQEWEIGCEQIGIIIVTHQSLPIYRNLSAKDGLISSLLCNYSRIWLEPSLGCKNLLGSKGLHDSSELVRDSSLWTQVRSDLLEFCHVLAC